jgi:tRNA pseudouridine38-40 synthase
MLIAYDGTEFHGWQKQPEMRTVEGVVEQAVRRVVRHQASLNGSGRTDSGVHARGQVANFLSESHIPCSNLCKAIGSRLPKDVSLIRVGEAALDFRSSRDASSKLYRYTIYNDSHRPVERHLQRYAYHYWHPLDVERMRAAAMHLVGEHDFAALATKGSPRETTVRTVFRLDVQSFFNEIRIDVEGSGFLYNMVRNIAGTLIEVGRGHWSPERMPEILASGDRSQAGPTAPARGLCLQWVKYPPDKFNREMADLCRPEHAAMSAQAESNDEDEGLPA